MKLPRQVYPHDSALSLLLTIEAIFLNPSELLNIKSIDQRVKLHLFPRVLALSMRHRLLKLFYDLSRSTSAS